MMKHWIVIMAGLAIVAGNQALASEDAPTDAELEQRLEEARKRLDEAAREIGELSGKLHGDAMQHVIRMAHKRDGKPKAMIGISIGEKNENGKVTGASPDGVYVLGVSPGGPAEKAGLKSGDVITEINGQSLAGGGKASRDKLMAVMSEVNPGDSVAIQYLRDGNTRNLELETGEMSAPHITGFVAPGDGEVFRWNSRHGAPMPPMPDMPDMPVMPDMPMIAPMLARRWGGMELVPMTPKLGSYFNTDTGLLVVRAPETEGLELQEGDVILKIGEREPKDVRHAMRILRSYSPGETAEIEIMRKKRKRKIKYEIKENETLGATSGYEYRFMSPEGKGNYEVFVDDGAAEGGDKEVFVMKKHQTDGVSDPGDSEKVIINDGEKIIIKMKRRIDGEADADPKEEHIIRRRRLPAGAEAGESDEKVRVVVEKEAVGT